jgi:hypothetical protein
MRVTIRVTAEDIRQGKRNNCYGCPITLAVARALPKFYAKVYKKDLHLIPRQAQARPWQIFALPEQATRFVRDFDAGQVVEPFSFVIEL